MENGYHFDNDFLNSDVCGIATQYAAYKHAFFRHESTIKSTNSKSGTEFYGDTFAESILTFLTPHVEGIVGKKLLPQYSLLRNFQSGEQVSKKVENNNSDYTARIVLGQEYKGVDESYNWGVFIDGQYVEQNVGSLMVYDSDIEIYKEPMLASMGSYQIEMVAYWVEADSGKSHFKFDGRQSLGMRKA